MSTYVVTKIKDWERKFKGVKKHVPKGEPTPFPFEQLSSHFQWFNQKWTLCHGYVHDRPHAWVEYKGVVVDMLIPASRVKKANFKPLFNAAFKTVKKAGQETLWQKQFKAHAHDKDIYYRKFKPTQVRRYSVSETCAELDVHQQYGDWLLELGPSARQRFMAAMRGE